MKNNKKIIILSSTCHAFDKLYCQGVDIPTPKKLQNIEMNQEKNDLDDNEFLDTCRNNILTKGDFKIKNVYALRPIKEFNKATKNRVTTVNPNERNRNIKKFR